jgi:hypothetical protein
MLLFARCVSRTSFFAEEEFSCFRRTRKKNNIWVLRQRQSVKSVSGLVGNPDFEGDVIDGCRICTMDSVDNWLSFSKRYALIVFSGALGGALGDSETTLEPAVSSSHFEGRGPSFFSPLQDYVQEHVSGTFVNLFRIYCVYIVVVQGMLCVRAR